MNMVGHHDKVAHPVSLTIEMQQRIINDLSQLAALEHTSSLAGVQEIFTMPVECFLKLGSEFRV